MKKAETAAEEEEYMAIRRAVKGLHFGRWEEKEAAAATIRDLAKRDASKKRALAELGVIPSLVSMLVEAKDGGACRSLASEALVELANGSFTNKVLMVDSGLLTKLPQLHSKTNLSTIQSLTPLLHSISSLAKAQFPINSLPILSFLLPLLRSPSPPTDTTTLTSTTTTLYNLSTQLDNSKSIISAGAVHLLLNLCFLQTKATEPGLATLANLALTEEGKRAIEEDSLVPEVLVAVMARDEEPKCQELAAYLLMVVARRSVEKRRRMVEVGVVEMLMEVGLIGRSRLVRERAIRMLGWLKDGRNGEMEEEGYVKSCRREIRCMVKQSLDRNMESILRRGGGKKKKNTKNCSDLKLFVAVPNEA
ncbi:U-box domain-containing protein 2 isoform X1 [Dendrobium catenatum]|uniref:U-box domain-containing protein 2 isoform X1 n=1 Tax=Dendrobium catenatum TaxID=906689 RepID=UPI00109FFE45|nr:U-box domain-containing protein 2 isoform X1 [Dendrobium catenatum]